MQEDDLNEGIRNIEEVLQRLEKRAYDAELLKDFPKPAPAPKPGATITEAQPPKPETVVPEAPPPKPAGPLAGEPVPEPEPEPPAVKQNTVQPPMNEPASEAVKTEAPAGAPAEEGRPGILPVPQNPEQPPLNGPAAAVVKRTGPKAKTLTFFCLGLALAGAVYQFGFNSGSYRFKQASRLEQLGDKTKALAAYQRLVQSYPGSAEAAASQFSIGTLQAAQGDPGAVESYEKFLRVSRAGDVKVPEAKFRLAELRFKDGDFFVAGNLYSAADVRASEYSQKALERLGQIKTAQAQVAEAKKNIAADPARAVAAFSAVLADYPGYAEAKAGLEEAREKQLSPVKKGRPAAPAKAAARKDLARSILLTNRKRLGGRAPDGGKSLKTAPVKDRYAACYPVWLAEKNQAALDAGLVSKKKDYACDALKESVTACERSQANTRAIKAQTAEERAAKVRSVVPDWTVQKQESLDKKMLKLYEENQCAELLELVTLNEGEAALDAF